MRLGWPNKTVAITRATATIRAWRITSILTPEALSNSAIPAGGPFARFSPPIADCARTELEFAARRFPRPRRDAVRAPRQALDLEGAQLERDADGSRL